MASCISLPICIYTGVIVSEWTWRWVHMMNLQLWMGQNTLKMLLYTIVPPPICSLHSIQILTLDNWQVLARTAMLGCDEFGYNTGLPAYDDLCVHPHAQGWTGAWFFIIFLYACHFILLNLFEAIIVTSMGLLRESIADYKSVMDRVEDMRNKYHFSHHENEKMLDLFECVDSNDNGRLTVSRL